MSRMVTAPGRAREYETIYILRPDIDADGADKVGQRVNEVVGRENGKMTKVELWGRRRLAYDISKHKRGVYVYLKYLGNGGVVSEIERNLRLSDDVIKYQTVLVRNNVESDLTINADEIKFERVELAPMEDDREESRERQLGLIEPEKPVRAEGDPGEGYMDEIEGEAPAAPEEEES